MADDQQESAGVPAPGPAPEVQRPLWRLRFVLAAAAAALALASLAWTVPWAYSLAAFALYGADVVVSLLDELRRPKMYYGKQIHETCPRRADFDAGRFAKKFGDSGCLYELGCKGPVTYADCPTRMWNSGTNWCVGAGSSCHG